MGQLVSSPKKHEKTKEHSSKASEDEGDVSPCCLQEPVTLINNTEAFLRKYGKLFREKGFVPDFLLVKESQSSKFVDEDGDEADEFYTEKVDGNLRKLTRIHTNLKPKGKEKHVIPRLSPDLPVVILELPHGNRSHV